MSIRYQFKHSKKPGLLVFGLTLTTFSLQVWKIRETNNSRHTMFIHNMKKKHRFQTMNIQSLQTFNISTNTTVIKKHKETDKTNDKTVFQTFK